MWTDGQRPCPLSEFLEAGGNPREVLGHAWDLFTDSIREALAFPDEADPTAIVDEDELSEGIRQLEEGVGGGSSWTPGGAAGFYVSWCGDLAADPATLGPALAAFLTPPERAKIDADVLADQRPHPIVVGRSESGCGWWRCLACGRQFPIAVDAFNVTYTEGSRLSYQIEYCADCIRGAAAMRRSPKRSRR